MTLMKLLLKDKNNFLAKNYFEIQVCITLVCALYAIKYGKNFFGSKKYCVTSIRLLAISPTNKICTFVLTND